MARCLTLFSHPDVTTAWMRMWNIGREIGVFTRNVLSISRRKILDKNCPSFHWWLAYDVLKSLIMQIMIDFPQILVSPVRPLYQIWSHLDQRKQSYRQMKLEYFLLCYVEKWASGVSSHQHGCCDINVWSSSKLWTAVTFVFIGLSTR